MQPEVHVVLYETPNLQDANATATPTTEDEAIVSPVIDAVQAIAR